ncbi:MAG: ankyrin repeat domain-containing protein [Planctomycetota bacterium]|jgi:hypothetical protein
MKFSLPLKLAVFVVILFTLVITACVLWAPIKIRYYAAKLKSDNPKERVKGIDGLLEMGRKGRVAIVNNFPDGKEAGSMLVENWNDMYEMGVYSSRGGIGSLGVTVRYFDTPGGPFHVAAREGWIEVMKILIERGIEIDTPVLALGRVTYGNGFETEEHENDDTALHIAAEEGHLEIIRLLIENGADINPEDQYGFTPLHNAVARQHVRIARLLIEEGADVNNVGLSERTPLHEATGTMNIELVKLLVENGAKVNVIASSGLIARNHESSGAFTPLDNAINTQEHEIAGYLRTNGGKTGEEMRAGKK